MLRFFALRHLSVLPLSYSSPTDRSRLKHTHLSPMMLSSKRAFTAPAASRWAHAHLWPKCTVLHDHSPHLLMHHPVQAACWFTCCMPCTSGPAAAAAGTSALDGERRSTLGHPVHAAMHTELISTCTQRMQHLSHCAYTPMDQQLRTVQAFTLLVNPTSRPLHCRGHWLTLAPCLHCARMGPQAAALQASPAAAKLELQNKEVDDATSPFIQGAERITPPGVTSTCWVLGVVLGLCKSSDLVPRQGARPGVMGCVGADGTAADAGAVAWEGCFTQANCHSFFLQLRLA